jgi:hypothetical protein
MIGEEMQQVPPLRCAPVGMTILLRGERLFRRIYSGRHGIVIPTGAQRRDLLYLARPSGRYMSSPKLPGPDVAGPREVSPNSSHPQRSENFIGHRARPKRHLP